MPIAIDVDAVMLSADLERKRFAFQGVRFTEANKANFTDAFYFERDVAEGLLANLKEFLEEQQEQAG